MRLISTRGEAPAVDLATALARGLAPDGGLYLPAALPPLPPAVLDGLTGAPLEAVAEAVLGHLLAGEVAPARLSRLIAEALDFPIPLVQLDEQVFLLELFHGPTLAFKDVAARVMARLLPLLAARDAPKAAGEGPLTILTATSGDTGGAVAQAFHGVAGTRVAVLYPRGRVTPLQERQIATLGGNVRAFAVDGSFDDCQRLVKAAFLDRSPAAAQGLVSANSINIGRLLPQIVYHVHAVAQLAALRGRPTAPLMVVPSGNFGNLAAGLMARRLGLRVARYWAATNANDVVPGYLSSGRYRPRASRATLSSAMDVGDPSNLARIRFLYGDDLDALRRDVGASSHSDDETRDTIRAVEARSGYVLDPHTAIGVRALETARGARQNRRLDGIVLATAHAIKFREIVEPVIGRTLPLGARLAALFERPLRPEPLAAELPALRAALAAWRS